MVSSKIPIVIFVMLGLFSLTGCGGSSSGGSSDPFSVDKETKTDADGTGTVPTTPVTVQDPVFSLDVSTDLQTPTDLTLLPQVDANIGTVLLTARLLNVAGGVFVDPQTGLKTEAGSPVPNQKVTFTVLAGPGAISYTTPSTDKNGEVKAILTTGNVLFTTNVIVEATSTVDGKNYRGYTSFQIIRGSGVIMFTDFAGLKPGEQTSMLPEITKIVDPAVTQTVSFLQLIPFKLTDSNGNPRVGVPITLSTYSTTGDPAGIIIDYLTTFATEPNMQTITTDAAGMGIFNVSITMMSPPEGSFTAESVVFKAITNDPIPVTGYVGASYSLTSPAPQEAPEPSI